MMKSRRLMRLPLCGEELTTYHTAEEGLRAKLPANVKQGSFARSGNVRYAHPKAEVKSGYWHLTHGPLRVDGVARRVLNGIPGLISFSQINRTERDVVSCKSAGRGKKGQANVHFPMVPQSIS